MARICAKNAMFYIATDKVSYTTDISISLSRDVAEVTLHGQEFNEKCIGPYSGEFSGSAVVDDADSVLFDALTAGESATLEIYPTSTTSDYWSFSGYFTGWDASGPADGFWTIDFSGVVDGEVSKTGFV